MTSEGGALSDKRREAAQVGEQERRLDGLADAAPQRTGQHARRAAPAEIGLERRGQRGARGQCGERRRGEARRLAQAVGLVGREGTRADPAEPRAVRRGPTASSWTGPAARLASQRRPASPAEPSAPDPECAPAAKPKASITSLLSARHSQVRRAISGWGEASVSAPPASGVAVLDQALPRDARKSSGVGVAAAESTSQARVELSAWIDDPRTRFVVISMFRPLGSHPGWLDRHSTGWLIFWTRGLIFWIPTGRVDLSGGSRVIELERHSLEENPHG